MFRCLFPDDAETTDELLKRQISISQIAHRKVCIMPPCASILKYLFSRITEANALTETPPYPPGHRVQPRSSVFLECDLDSSVLLDAALCKVFAANELDC